MKKFILVNDTVHEIKIYKEFHKVKDFKKYLTEEVLKTLCEQFVWDYNNDGLRITDSKGVNYYYYISNYDDTQGKWINLLNNTYEYRILE